MFIPSGMQKEIEEAEKEHGVKIKRVNIKKETTSALLGDGEPFKDFKKWKDGTFLTSWEEDVK